MSLRLTYICRAECLRLPALIDPEGGNCNVCRIIRKSSTLYATYCQLRKTKTRIYNTIHIYLYELLKLFLYWFPFSGVSATIWRRRTANEVYYIYGSHGDMHVGDHWQYQDYSLLGYEKLKEQFPPKRCYAHIRVHRITSQRPQSRSVLIEKKILTTSIYHQLQICKHPIWLIRSPLFNAPWQGLQTMLIFLLEAETKIHIPPNSFQSYHELI
jgi:hypothetical protein